jgi:Lamin Tail Domain/Secretion system C-terminal sorting domain
MMKKIYFLFFCCLITRFAAAQQLNAGDLMCVGFNADGNDDLSFVALTAIPTNTTLYFRDDEWSGTAFNTGESAWSWNSGATPLAAGTIIALTNFGLPSANANVGTLTAAIPTNFGIAAGGDAVFVYQGTDVNTPTRFISVVSNGVATDFTTLTGTGLVEGSTAQVLTPTGTDIAAYKGVRSGLDRSGYIAAINNILNWDTQDASGDQSADGTAPDVPFSTTPFVFGGGDVTTPSVLSATLETASQIKLVFSENITRTSATTVANFTFSPTIAINSITFDSVAKTAILNIGTMTIGKRYTLSVNGLVDLANNTQTTPSVFNGLFLNNYAGADVVISEIMYNPGANGDTLEFIEIYNKSNAAIPIGGLKFTEGLLGTMPDFSLGSQKAVCFAYDTAAFRRFYGVEAIGQWATGQALGNGGEKLTIANTFGGIVDSLTYDDIAPWPLEPDGMGPSLEIITVAVDNALPSNWRKSTTSTGKTFAAQTIFASPNALSIIPISPEIAFETPSVSTVENGSVTLKLTLKTPNGTASKIDVRLASVKSTAVANEDFTFQTTTLSFAGDTAAASRVATLTFTPTNDNLKEADEYLALELTNPINATIGTVSRTILFIQDDESKAPTATNELKIKQLTSYANGAPANNTAEIVAYEAVSKRLFIANSVGDKIDIVDFTNPSTPRAVRSIAVKGVNSVSAQNGYVVACVEDSIATNPGKLIFMDSTGQIITQLKVGVLPDMVAISPDGNWIMTADEAQPNDAYTIDPEGSVHLVDMRSGVYYVTQADVTRIGFTTFNARKSEIQATGVRVFGKMKDSTTTVSVAQDLEPEYIAFAPDSRRAMVVLQENNAVVMIDVLNKRLENLNGIPAIVPLGYKNHTLVGNGLDATDQGTAVNLANWNVRGMYMPDAIAAYQTEGKTYFITANEGDARAYTGLNEESTVAAIRLDPTKFPDSTLLRNNAALGRMVITNASGDTDGDGDMDEIHVFGGRSFSILNDTGKIVWDSGDWLERLTKDSTYFNASNGAGITKKARSRAKGPEPEGVAVATLAGRQYAFIALERTGGVMAFNVTNPTSPQFVAYANNRKGTTTDDRGSEGILFIPSAQSPNGKNLLLLANETSATISVFEIDASPVSTKEQNTEGADYTLYPNPSAGTEVYLSRAVVGQVVNISGQTVLNFTNPTTTLDVSSLQNGLYFIVSSGNATKRLVIQK